MAVIDPQTSVAAQATRWAGVGHSLLADPRQAGAEAAERAIDGRAASLVVLFSSDRWANPGVLAGVDDRAGGARVVGCSVPSHISSDGPSEDGVFALALGGPGIRASTAAASSVDGPRVAGRLATEQLSRENVSGQRELVMLLTASQAGDQNEIVRGAYGVLGAGVPLVGGCTGKSTSAAPSCQFHGKDVFVDAVVAASLVSDGPVGIGVSHGLTRVGERMIVTRSSGGRVLGLDGRPALDAYLDSLDAPTEVSIDQEAFATFAAAHPLGLSRSSGSDQARCVGAADFAERSLLCVAEVPEGSPVWLLHETIGTTVASAAQACREAVEALEGATPMVVLVFDCIGRRKLLGAAGASQEVRAMSEASGGAPLAGFYTHGEIARTRGVRGFHNKTVVALALG